MIVAVVFVGLMGGIASGGTLHLALGLGWVATICAFYAGAFAGMGLAALRVARLRDERETSRPVRDDREACLAETG